MSRRILIVDDEEAILRSLEGILQDEGYEVVLAATGEEGLDKAGTEDPDLILLDLWLPAMDGFAVLEELRRRQPSLPVLMMSGHGSVETAVKAAGLGAYDFIEKPLNLDKVLLAIENARKTSQLAEENRFWRREAECRHTLIGKSRALEALRSQILVVAQTNASVLVVGEQGAGKQLAAQAIHRASKRASGLFVTVLCAAGAEGLEGELFGHEKGASAGEASSSRGKVDLAEGGTLYLEEIGDMPLETQAKILRLLRQRRYERVGGSRTHQVDVRVVAATSKNLEEEVRDGRFREDLYLLLKETSVGVQPLRERRDDIPPLVEHFIRLFCDEEKREPLEIAPEAQEILRAQNWPGNVRELKNMAGRMVILCRGTVIGQRELALAEGKVGAEESGMSGRRTGPEIDAPKESSTGAH